MATVSMNGRRPSFRAAIDALRRRASMRVDQSWARAVQRLRPTLSVPFDGTPRFALICVNFSTTHYVKLMLLTLSEQADLTPLQQVVIVDNGSRDGGKNFLRWLDQRVPDVRVQFRSRRLHHAVGMRAGVRLLDQVDGTVERPANILVFIDADVIFRDPLALRKLSDVMADGAALAGEPRRDLAHGGPDIQASFFAVRRDIYARHDIDPLVHSGAPARRHQQSIVRAGLTFAEFASNHGGYILHRGRTGVAAASEHRRFHPYASVQRNAPHFMHVPDGSAIWHSTESRHSALLQDQSTDAMLDALNASFARIRGARDGVA